MSSRKKHELKFSHGQGFISVFILFKPIHWHFEKKTYCPISQWRHTVFTMTSHCVYIFQLPKEVCLWTWTKLNVVYENTRQFRETYPQHERRVAIHFQNIYYRCIMRSKKGKINCKQPIFNFDAYEALHRLCYSIEITTKLFLWSNSQVKWKRTFKFGLSSVENKSDFVSVLIQPVTS